MTSEMVRKLIYLPVISVLTWIIFQYWNQLFPIFLEHYTAIFIIIPISMYAIFLQSKNFTQLLHTTNKPALLDTTKMWALSGLTNYLGPFQPGLAVRAAYFKSHGISVRETLQTTVKQLVISIWIGLLVFSIFAPFSLNENIQKTSIFTLTLFLVAPLLENKIIATIKRVIDKNNEIHNDTSWLRLNKIGQYKLFFSVYISLCLSSWVIYEEFNANLYVYDYAILAVILVFSSLISITPNNLGIQELFFGYAAHAGGLSIPDGIAIALLYRVTHIFSCAFIILLFRRNRYTNRKLF